MKPFFSVLVPVYRVEAWIRQCIDSILGQTFENFELILVDDGSPDDCPSICDAYEKKDERVSVIHKTNGGLVSARVAGIHQASGEYIVNVDGDDWIADDMLQQAYKKIVAFQADIVSFAFSCEYGSVSKTDAEPLAEGFYDETAIKKQIYPRVLMDKKMQHVHSNLCGKVIRRSLLYPCQTAVDPRISLGEDLICIVSIYNAGRSVYICEKAMYFYRQREASITKTIEFQESGRELLLLKALEKKKTRIPDFRDQIDRYSMAMCFWLLQRMVDQRSYGSVKKLGVYINHPLFRNHITKAKFGKTTIKTRIAIELIKRNRLKGAYVFLSICRILKNRREYNAERQ